MEIACPACSTRYVVRDSAIGENGRLVRCAKCRHSWFEDGHPPAANPAEALTPPQPAPEAAGARAGATDSAPLPPASESSGTYAATPYADLPSVQDFAETPSSFAHEPPFRPRRRPATFWIVAIILFLLLIAAAVAAMASFGIPDWLPLPRGSFAEARPDLQLNFPPNQQSRRPLPDGNSFFNVSGTITNVSRERRKVPTLEIVLHNAQRAIVYTLEAASPKPVLAPGESETIDQAIIDAPKSARTATIGWKAR